MKICIAQINYNARNTQRHIERLQSIINNYKASDLIVFPELILHGHPSVQKPEGYLYRKVKVVNRFISKSLYQFVRNTKARVIIGELQHRGEKYYNKATYIDNDTIQSYTKTHVHWTEHFVPGRELKVFESALGKIGITICFDAAFPEVWRVLALKGAPLIVNISAVPKTFPVAYMWRRLAGAAICNQVFVVYANRPGPFFSGFSAVFNPRGETLVHANSEETIIEVDINLKEVHQWRHEEQIYSHRRPLLYREIVKRPQYDIITSDSQVQNIKV
jgi:predicted amidohydrolase